MFDLAGIKAMGESIETFTTETHAGLLDIAMQLRINNALAAIDIADQRHRADGMSQMTDPIDVLAEATAMATNVNFDAR